LRFTIDTNILLYSVDPRVRWKQDVALDIVKRARLLDCWLTLQAVSEFYSVATRKRFVDAQRAAELAGAWLSIFPTASDVLGTVRKALPTAAAGRLSYWDALLVITAAEAGCGAVLSEDMGDGMKIEGVEIINPFSAEGLAPRAARLLE
jgi:predicted nucleic acid-binding protein